MGHHFDDEDIRVDGFTRHGIPYWGVKFPRHDIPPEVIIELNVPKKGVFENPDTELDINYCKNDLAPKIAKVLRDVLK